ncbi:MAG: ferrochelatase [Gammaproteobacteria bacterium]|nr:ferrochelatase [Gammaproteobacteria bacterium]
MIAIQQNSSNKIGVLLSNLGTPDEPTPAAVRPYLAEFLWDPRIVSIPRPLWWLILHGVILRRRPVKSAQAYAKIWMDEGSPLMVYARKQELAIKDRLKAMAPNVHVVLGMRYGHPSIDSALAELQQSGCECILLFPLYPQQSTATTASTFDAMVKTLFQWSALPDLRMIAQYHADTAYIQSLVNSIQEFWEQNGQAERLLFSFHGMPKRTRAAGDPYYDQCHTTAKLVSAALNLKETQWQIVFQSRFGKEEWLTPYADKTLATLPLQGVKKVDLICPGFSADCLETLEEMAMENKQLFLDSGGEQYRYIPALNVRDDHIDALTNIIQRNIAGW